MALRPCVRCEELFRDLKDRLHVETIRLHVQHPERVAKLLLGLMLLYQVPTLIGAEVQKRGLRRKIRRSRVSLVFLGLRALRMPCLLAEERLVQALFRSRWSLSCESRQVSARIY